ncbi:MAG: carboxymuconolactone decarboxylase family protein [Magnetovibrio sp.]|nr:carboxymuconolactone decarboxylase family protein [Magnetovibrio sp.]
MSLKTIHSVETAPQASQEILKGFVERLGFVPNIASIMAESPATLKGYTATYGLLSETDFTPAEQQLIFLAVSRANSCTYCVAAHSVAGKMMGLDDETIAAVRNDTPILDSKLAAIVSFVSHLIDTRGFAKQDRINDFLAAGHTEAQILEVIMGIATKTISNYANHIANTPLDDAFAPMAWTPPAKT